MNKYAAFSVASVVWGVVVCVLLLGSFHWDSWGLWWLGVLVLLCGPSLKTEESRDE